MRDRLLLGVGVDVDRPGAAHGIGQQRQVGGITAECFAVDHHAAELDPVGTIEDEGERQALDCVRLGVARQGGGVHRLAGAIDAAFGPGEHVDRAGGRAPGDAAVGQVEAGAGHVEEDIVVLALAGDDDGGRQGGAGPHQPGIKAGTAIGVGAGGRQDLIVLGDQLQVDVRQRCGAGQRTGEDVQAVGAGEGRKPDVGDDEPLGGAGVPILRGGVFDGGGHHVDAGAALRQCLVDGEAGNDVLVDLAGNVDRALPDQFAALTFDPVGAVAVELCQELRGGQQRGDVAVADPVKRELGAVGVDGDDRDPAPGGRRKHEVLAGEAHGGRTVLHVDFEIDLRLKVFLDRGRQTGAQCQLVTLAVGQPLDADLVVLGFHRFRRGTVERDEGRVIDAALDQRIGELDAGARGHAIGIDRVADDTEAPAGAKIIIGGLDGLGRDQLQAGLVGIEGAAIVLRVFEALGEHGQCIRPALGGAGQQVAVEGGEHALAGYVAVAGDGVCGSGHFQPELRIFRGNRQSALEGIESAVEVARHQRLAALLQQRIVAEALLAFVDRQPGLLLARVFHQLVGDEIRPLGRADIRFCPGLDDAAGHGACKGVELVEVRLQEAPLHLRVIGEGAAFLVSDATGFALGQRYVLLGAKIEPKIVAVAGGHDAASAGGKRRWRERQKPQQECSETVGPALGHNVPPHARAF